MIPRHPLHPRKTLPAIALALAIAAATLAALPRAESDLGTRARLAEGTQILCGLIHPESPHAAQTLLAAAHRAGGWRAIDALGVAAGALAILLAALAFASRTSISHLPSLAFLCLAPAMFSAESPASPNSLSLALLALALALARFTPPIVFPPLLCLAAFLWARITPDALLLVLIAAFAFPPPPRPGRGRRIFIPRAVALAIGLLTLSLPGPGPSPVARSLAALTRDFTDGVWCIGQCPPLPLAILLATTALWAWTLPLGGRSGRNRALLVGILCIAPAFADARHLASVGGVILPLLLPRVRVALRLARSHDQRRARPLALAIPTIAILLALAHATLPAPARYRPPDARILDPAVVLQALESRGFDGPLYASAQARPFVVVQAPDLLAPDERAETPATAARVAAASLDNSEWNALQDERDYRGALLSGASTPIQPLARLLLHSERWTLAWLDQSAILFTRSDLQFPRWTSDGVESLAASIAGLPNPVAAQGFLQLGRHLAAVDLRDDARKCLERAAGIEPDAPAPHLELATLEATSKNWDAALRHAERFLKLEPRAPEGLYVHAQILAALQRWALAFHVTQTLIDLSPDDSRHLLLAARVAHAVRDFDSELRCLRRLIRLADERHLPDGAYQILLAQCLARAGKPEEAIGAYASALRSPGLSPEERRVVRENLDGLRERLRPATPPERPAP